MRKPKRRRALRIILKLILVVVVLAIVAIGALAIVVHTDWGRNRLRAELVATLDDMLVGEVEIGALEGSVFGELVLRDVVIHDREGRRAITVERVRFEVGLIALVKRRIELQDVVANGVVVDGHRRDGRLNLAELIAPTDEPGTWGIEIAALEIREASIALDLDGAVEHFDDVIVRGALAMPTEGAVTSRLEIAGRWRERSAAFALRGDVRATDGAIAVPSAELAVGELRIVARDASRSASGAIAGHLAVDIPADAIGRVVTGATNPAIAMELSVKPAPGDATAVVVEGHVAGSQVRGALNIGLDGPRVRIDGTVSAKQLDARRLAPTLISTAVDAELDVDVVVDPARAGLAVVDGTIGLQGRGRIGHTVLDELAARIAIANGTVTVDATARAPGGTRARLEATGGLREDGAIVITRAALVANADHLEPLIQRWLDVRGAAQIDLVAKGTILAGVPDLELSGHVIGMDMRAGTTQLEHGRIDFALAGTPKHPTGSARATIRGAQLDGVALPSMHLTVRSRSDGAFGFSARSGGAFAAIGRWALAVDGVARLEGDGASFVLGDYNGRARGVDFRGRGGVIAFDPTRLAVRRVRTAVAGGTIEVDGHYSTDGPNERDFAGHVTAQNVDLAVIADLLAHPGVLGRASLEADVQRRRGQIRASVAGSVSKLVTRPEGAPIDLGFSAQLSPSRIVVDVDARGDRARRVIASLDVVPPRRLTDVGAWTRLDRSAIRRLDIRATELELAELATAIGLAPIVQGRIDGVLALGPSESRGSLHARGLVTTFVSAPIDLDVEFSQPRRPATFERRLGPPLATSGSGGSPRPANPAAAVRPEGVGADRSRIGERHPDPDR